MSKRTELPRPWLLLDVSYLCHRALHTTGHLTTNDEVVGVVYGVLRDIQSLQQVHQTDRIVFCFDSKSNVRKESYPEYKANRIANRATETPEWKSLRLEMYSQIKVLRRHLLSQLGFSNVFVQRGREADDLIARISLDIVKHTNDECIIVSADKDLYQLLNRRCTMWNPSSKKFYTQEHLHKEYGVWPIQWVQVKAIAGDAGDNLPGVQGVAEKTAARHLLGTLAYSSVAAEKIRSQCPAQLKRNLELMVLPFKGTKSVELKSDTCSKKKWDALTRKLGMKTLKKGGSRGKEKT